MSATSETSVYKVTAIPGDELSKGEFVACIAIIKSGRAVNLDSAAAELLKAPLVAIARSGDTIVGVGAVKRVRKGYALAIAGYSGTVFDSGTSELGYVAVDRDHWGHRLSHRIVAALMSQRRDAMFATTDSEPMKKTLARAGFTKKGHEWRGEKGTLSLWIKKASEP